MLDYGIGNLRSAHKALVRLGAPACLVEDPAEVATARGVVLPGVGEFGACARALEERGLGEAARRAVAAGVPFLGICVGFQLLFEESEESPGTPGLGLIAGRVASLPDGVKRPQMQWNVLERVPGTTSRFLAGAGAAPWVYFVHSYAPPVVEGTTAVCDYGGPQCALIERGTLWGAQFHPEKSGNIGLGMLENFVQLCAGEGA